MEAVSSYSNAAAAVIEDSTGLRVAPMIIASTSFAVAMLFSGSISRVGIFAGVFRSLCVVALACLFVTNIMAIYANYAILAALEVNLDYAVNVTLLTFNTIICLRSLMNDDVPQEEQVVPSMMSFFGKNKAFKDGKIKDAVSGYYDMHQSSDQALEKRKSDYTTMVNFYYDLATDFYEYGWGQSFHFAPRYFDEGIKESILRHEHFLASKLNVRPGDRILDVGCGVGGPARNIARFTGAHVTGLNNNSYQITRANVHSKRMRMENQTNFVKGNFMEMPFEANTFDGVYAIEATCHAPEKTGVYGECFRVLKPGGYFCCYEWLMTPKYDSSNEEHVAIKKNIEVGDGLPDIDDIPTCLESLRKVGFEIVWNKDVAAPDSPLGHQDTPWYAPLSNKSGITNFRSSWIGRALTHAMVWTLETLRIAPKGTTAVSSFLQDGATGLVDGGEKDLFTPSFFFMARKPQA